MEPLSVITVIATQHGIQAVLRALTGGDGLGSFAADVVGALAASEDRLEQQLTRIEGLLDQVLEQRYTTSLKIGKRILSDAVPGARGRTREEELRRARDAFREASASARTPFQEALAERYLALCAIALGQTRAARASVRRLEGVATTALLVAHEAAVASWDRAEEVVRRERGVRAYFDRERQVDDRRSRFVDAADETAALSLRLIEEASLLRLGLDDQENGPGGHPMLSFVPRRAADPGRRAYDSWLATARANAATPDAVRVGAFSVRLHGMSVRKSGIAHAVDLDLSVRIDPPLPHPVTLWLLPTGAERIEQHVTVATVTPAAGAVVRQAWDRGHHERSVAPDTVAVRTRDTFLAHGLSAARDLTPQLLLGGVLLVQLAPKGR